MEKEINLLDWIVGLILLSAMGFPGQYASAYSEQLGTVFEYLCLVIMIGLLSLRIVKEHLLFVQWNRIILYCWVAFVFLASMVVSNYKGEQFISCFRLVATVLFALWLSDLYTSVELVTIVSKVQVAVLALTGLFCALNPDLAFENTTMVSNALIGFYSTKNTFGGELAFGIIMVYLHIQNRRNEGMGTAFWWVVWALQVVALIMCQSVGMIFVMGLSLLLLKIFEKRRLNLSLIFWIGSIVFMVVALTVLPFLSTILAMVNKDITLSGRTDLWTEILRLVEDGDHSLFGYGFAMFWRDASGYSLLQSQFNKYSFLGNIMSGSHNGMLDLLLNVGILGTAFLVVSMVQMTSDLRETPQADYRLICTILLFCMLYGWTERLLSTFDYKTLFLFVALGYSTKVMEDGCAEYG